MKLALRFALIALLLALGASETARAQAQLKPLEALVAAAEKEGQLSIAGPPGETYRVALIEWFQKKFPRIRVEYNGASGRDQVPRIARERQSGVFNWDIGLFRDFTLKERFHIQFRAEAFNFTNTPHWAGPDNYIGDANSIDQKTGRVTDPGSFMTLNNGMNDLAREGIDERQFRLGLRISF